MHLSDCETLYPVSPGYRQVEVVDEPLEDRSESVCTTLFHFKILVQLF